jgi:integrase
MADADIDTGAAAITVNVALLTIGGRLVWGKPKSKAGERVVGLDKGGVEAGKAHRTQRERLGAGRRGRSRVGRSPARTAPRSMRTGSRRFKELAAEARLPVIKFHAARHTAATLALQAKVDTKIVSEQLAKARLGSPRISTSMFPCRCGSAPLRPWWRCCRSAQGAGRRETRS